ncbi:MAG: UvrD-helicase domain-containing protein, partial [Planctomycetes bacterium]|nr:UvrD-helicase domain-containing protein [Planctomycetota bacterium]
MSEEEKPKFDLNEEQREAVEHTHGALLVVAGAGSGKTRVIVEKIKHLVEQGMKPFQILAITFTN